MIKNKNKIKVIGIIVAATIVIIISYNVYNKYSENKKNVILLSGISKIDENFNNEDDRNKKIIILKELQEEYSNYKELKVEFNEVVSKYESEINTFQDSFMKEYEIDIKNNSLEDINDKIKINEIKDNLNTLMTNVKSEEDIVTTQEEMESYEIKINDLISLCDNKLKVIQETEDKATADAKVIADQKAKEEIAKAAAAEEVKKVATATEQKKAAASSSNGTSGTGTSKGTNSGGTSKNVSGNNGSYHETWSVDSNGNEIPNTRTRIYPDGTVIDQSGQSFNINDY